MEPTAACPVPAVFCFESHDVRTVEKNGDVWFVAKDVAEVLGYAKTENAIKSHCRHSDTCSLESGGQVRRLTIIPERDVYRLIMRSTLPAAEKFEDWIVSEVIPSIRKHGSYSVTPSVSANNQVMQFLEGTLAALKTHEAAIAQVTSAVESVQSSVTTLTETMRMHQWQCYELKAAVTQKAQDLHERFKVHYPLLFPGIWNFVKRHFRVTAYGAIPAVRFDEALLIVRGIELEQLPDYVQGQAQGVAK